MRIDKAYTINAPSDSKEIDIDKKKERSKSNTKNNDHYNSEYIPYLAAPCNKNRTMRYDNESESIYNKGVIPTNKLKVPWSLQPNNTRKINIRSKILHDVCSKNNVKISCATHNSNPRRTNTVDTPTQLNSHSQSVDNNLSSAYSRNPHTPAKRHSRSRWDVL